MMYKSMELHPQLDDTMMFILRCGVDPREVEIKTAAAASASYCGTDLPFFRDLANGLYFMVITIKWLVSYVLMDIFTNKKVHL